MTWKTDIDHMCECGPLGEQTIRMISTDPTRQERLTAQGALIAKFSATVHDHLLPKRNHIRRYCGNIYIGSTHA